MFPSIFFLSMAGVDNNFLHTPMNIQSPPPLIHNGILVYGRWSHPVFIPLFGVAILLLESPYRIQEGASDLCEVDGRRIDPSAHPLYIG